MKQHLALLAGMVFLASGMTARTGNYGTFVAPLDDGLWSQTQWISAADAPEMNELVNDTSLAADGASWFLTTVKNAKKLKRHNGWPQVWVCSTSMSMAKP